MKELLKIIQVSKIIYRKIKEGEVGKNHLMKERDADHIQKREREIIILIENTILLIKEGSLNLQVRALLFLLLLKSLTNLKLILLYLFNPSHN
jgi:hypothetical protein